MTPTYSSSFGRIVRTLACSGFVCAPLVAQAGDAAPKNTVFKSSSGDNWTVSIKPAQRTAQAEVRSVPVPPPADIIPASATVAQEAPVQAVPQLAPAELPPVPVETRGQKGTGATTAHGVTVVPDSEPQLEVFGRRYADAYRSIPFNRAEYDANPSYRHDAAMELLFGQLRPTTIVKQMPAPKDDSPKYSPYKRFIPAYGDFSSYQSLPLPYPLFGRPNLPFSDFWNY